MTIPEPFPLRGIIGVVANSAAEIELAASHNLQCVEIRADLLLDAGLSVTELMACIDKTKCLGLACLVTLRHPDQGGKFTGSEADRIVISRQALQTGADIIDLESGTEAATQMLEEQAPMILSYHDFGSMPDEKELAELTRHMSTQKPLAIKIVPTAATLNDAIQMLSWVSSAEEKGPKRIGFAMGAAGACSRILTTAQGAPVTYTSFGKAVAPGQIALDSLLKTYRVMTMNQQTAVVAVVGSQSFCDQALRELNLEFSYSGDNKVAVAFAGQTSQSLARYKDVLRFSAIHSG